jgi:IMP dehydrogenase
MRIVNRGVDFDDVLLVPKISNVIRSREESNISTLLGKIKLRIPVIASPMKGIVGPEIIRKIFDEGGIGILHRFYNNDSDRENSVRNLWDWGGDFGVAVGLDDEFYYFALANGASIICVDVANGYLPSVRKFVDEIATYISNKKYNCELMAGNVATRDGAQSLYDSGASIIRVGIGSGQLCTTRNNTGVGIPQLTSIEDCCNGDWCVVADGGIKNSGDAVKALAVGADAVMIGYILGRCNESEHDGHISGMASEEFQKQFYGEVKKSVEGRTEDCRKTVPVDVFLKEFSWNMKSALTYLDSPNLTHLRATAQFINTGRGSIK